jgi:hypothetical protein
MWIMTIEKGLFAHANTIENCDDGWEKMDLDRLLISGDSDSRGRLEGL